VERTKVTEIKTYLEKTAQFLTLEVMDKKRFFVEKSKTVF
jgi:hypothetical protein